MLFRNAGQRERLGPSRDALHGGIQLKFSQRTGNAISHRDCPTDVVKPMLFGCKTASDRHHRPSPRESVQAEILQPIVRTVKTDSVISAVAMRPVSIPALEGLGRRYGPLICRLRIPTVRRRIQISRLWIIGPVRDR